MARTSPTPVTPTLAGAVLAFTAPDATGDIVDPNTTLVVTCGATGTTVTIDTTATVEGLSVGDAGGAVAANTTKVFKIGGAGLFAQASDAAVGPGRVLVNYSSITTVTRAVLKG